MPAPALLHAAALQALEAGICVVPTRSDGSKAPVWWWGSYHHKRSTKDEIDKWFASVEAGLGVITGAVSSNLEMLEFEGAFMPQMQDVIDACTGNALWNKIMGGYIEKTPGGGIHFYYRCEHPSTTKLAASETNQCWIETKGEGGFSIIAPSGGATHPTGADYVVLRGDWSKIPTLGANERDELYALMRSFDRSQAKVGATSSPPPRHGVDLPSAGFNAKHNCAELLEAYGWSPGAINTKTQSQLWRRPGKDGGLGSSGVLHLDTDRFKNFSTSADIPIEGTHDAFGLYGWHVHGGDFAAAGAAIRKELNATSSPLPVGRQASALSDNPYRELLLSADGLAGLPAPEPLIGQYLQRNSFAALYGQPGSGKSFVAISMALHVATGLAFLEDQECAIGKVIYIAAEGRGGLAQRQAAWVNRFKPQAGLENIAWLPASVDLCRDYGLIAELVSEVDATMVVIDTLNRTMPGRDENESSDMGAFIVGCEALRSLGVTVLVVHHTPKAGGSLRGHSSLLGALDTAIEVEFSNGVRTLKVTKQKDVVCLADTEFELSAEGQSVVVVKPARGAPSSEVYEEMILSYIRANMLGNGLGLGLIESQSMVPSNHVRMVIRQLLEKGKLREIAGVGNSFVYAPIP